MDKKAYENGSLGAMESYANYLSEGLHCTKNTKLAMKLYEEAMLKGSSTAAQNLGIEYRDQHNFEKAFSLYKIADWNLSVGMCYYYGIGISQDRLAAFRFFKDLSKNEIVLTGYETNEVNYMLGRMYLEGEVVERSIEKARHYLLLADEDGDHRSAQEILCIIGRE